MRVIEGRAHTVARLTYFGIGQSDDVKRGQSRPEMNFDGYLGRVNTRERAASNSSN